MKQLLLLLLLVLSVWLPTGCDRQQPPNPPAEVVLDDEPVDQENLPNQHIAPAQPLDPKIQLFVDDATKRLGEHEIQTAGLNFIAESYADNQLYELVKGIDDTLVAAKLKLQKIKLAQHDHAQTLIDQLKDLLDTLDQRYKLAIERAESLQIVEFESPSEEEQPTEKPKE